MTIGDELGSSMECGEQYARYTCFSGSRRPVSVPRRCSCRRSSSRTDEWDGGGADVADQELLYLDEKAMPDI